MAEAECRGPQQVAARLAAFARQRLPGREPADQLIEGLGRAPILLALVGGQVERDHRHVQAPGETLGIVLDQLAGAGGADQQHFGAEPLDRLARGGLEEFRGVAAEVAGLEGGVGHRRAAIPPLDHREQQVGIGVALGRMQHVMDAGHRRGDAHCPHMRRAFIGPEGQLHRPRPPKPRGGGADG